MNLEARLMLNELGFKLDRTMFTISANCIFDYTGEWQGFVATVKDYVKHQNSSVKDKINSAVSQMKEELNVTLTS
mgnify:CR=1 FL=1